MLSSKLQLTLRDRKVLAAICALVLVCSGLSAFVMHQIDVKAQSSALTMQTNSGGPYPGAPAYTVWLESGTYYSKTAYGVVSSSLTASTIINAALALGNVYIKNSGSSYVITSKLTPSSNRIITSDGATLDGSALDASTPIFEVLNVDNITISGFTLQNADHVAIYVRNSDNINILMNTMLNNGWGISTNAYAGETLTNLKIDGNTISNSVYHGLQITGRSSNPSGEASIIISSNQITNSGDGSFAYSTGIDVENWACSTGKVNVNIENNIVSYSWEDGIHCEKVNGTVIANGNTLVHNGIHSPATYGTGALFADVADGIVSNNIMRENGKYGFMGYQMTTYFHSLNVIGNTIVNNTDRGIYIGNVNALSGVYPTVLIQNNYIADNGQDGLDVFVAAGIGNITWLFTVSGNTFSNNLKAVGTDAYQGEIKLYASGSGTTYFQTYISGNIINCMNVHTYPIIIAYASNYIVQGNVISNQQRGVSISNSEGTNQFNTGSGIIETYASATNTTNTQVDIPYSLNGATANYAFVTPSTNTISAWSISYYSTYIRVYIVGAGLPSEYSVKAHILYVP